MKEIISKKIKKGYVQKIEENRINDNEQKKEKSVKVEKRDANFYDFSEEITPYYAIEGNINYDTEYYAYLIDAHNKNEKVNVHVHQLKQERIVHSIVNKRISNFINDITNNVQEGDIVFTGIYSLNDDNIQNYIMVAVTDNKQMKLEHFSEVKNIDNVNYSVIQDKLIEFCTEQMEAWDDDFLYGDSPSKYFKPILNFMKCT